MPRTLTDAPFLTGFAKRKPVLLLNDDVRSDLTAFPSLISVTTDADVAAELSGQHCAFTTDDGETIIPYEDNSSDFANGTFVGFVKCDRHTDSDDVVYWYFDDAGTDEEDPTNVWDSSFKAVYHLEQDPSGSAPQILDSTATNLDGTTGGSMTSGDLVTGKVGYGLDMDGSDDRVRASSAPTLTKPYTLEAVVKFTGSPGSNQYALLSHESAANGFSGDGVRLCVGRTGAYPDFVDNGVAAVSFSTLTVTTATWYHIAVVVDTSTVKCYVNGVEESQSFTSAPNSPSSPQFRLGHNGDTNYLNGVLDEVRRSDALRSAAWIKLTAQSLLNNADTFELGPLEESGGGGGGTTVTPTTATLTLTTFAPTVRTPRLCTPTTASLTTTKFAPTVSTPRLCTPTTASLTTTKFAPTVSTPRLCTPSTKALTLTTFAPTVLAPRTVTPTTKVLTLTTYAPDIGGSVSVVPSTASFVLTTLAPTVSTPRLATPSTLSLVCSTFAPTLLLPKICTPPRLACVLSTFAPTVTGDPSAEYSRGGMTINNRSQTIVINNRSQALNVSTET